MSQLAQLNAGSTRVLYVLLEKHSLKTKEANTQKGIELQLTMHKLGPVICRSGKDRASIGITREYTEIRLVFESSGHSLDFCFSKAIQSTDSH